LIVENRCYNLEVTAADFVAHKRHCLALLTPEKAGFPLPRLSPLGDNP